MITTLQRTLATQTCYFLYALIKTLQKTLYRMRYFLVNNNSINNICMRIHTNQVVNVSINDDDNDDAIGAGSAIYRKLERGLRWRFGGYCASKTPLTTAPPIATQPSESPRGDRKFNQTAVTELVPGRQQQ